MSTQLSTSDRTRILTAIATTGDLGVAESTDVCELLRTFMPVSEHLRALDPRVILVIGDRGAGKTLLFRALTEAGAQVQTAIGRVVPPGVVIGRPGEWLVGYSEKGRQFPPQAAFCRYAAEHGVEDLEHVWLGLLLSCLHRDKRLDQYSIPPAVASILQRDEAPRPGDLASATRAELEGCYAVLDQLDRDLERHGRTLVVSYDELDRLTPLDPDQPASAVRGLLRLWSGVSRRWAHIRPKVFLRRDLYGRFPLWGTDITKIAAQRVDLSWTSRDLYAVLLRHLVAEETVADFLRPALPQGIQVDELGWVPTDPGERAVEAVVHKLCGKLMGANQNKGYTFTWIPNHLSDANGRAVPRSIVRLFRFAASEELPRSGHGGSPLIHHTSLRRAMDRVSEFRAEELEEEFRWLRDLRSELAEQQLRMPVDRSQFEKCLARVRWKAESPGLRPAALVELLRDLGILLFRQDGRVDFPDLYMRGFGMRRHGGVRRHDAT